MENLDLFVLTRAVHVIDIGGVAFVTAAPISALKQIGDTGSRLEPFEQLEGRFAFQAGIVTVITGLSGFCMLEAMPGKAISVRKA